MTTASDSFSAPGVEHSTLVELLLARALHEPHRVAYRFLDDGEASETTITYGELHRRALSISALLHSYGAAGERALLLYPAGLDYVAAFFGCLYAGVVAVPAYPPRSNRNLHRLDAMAADAQATLALSTRQILTRMESSQSQSAQLERLRRVATDDVSDEAADGWLPSTPRAGTPAYLQYTSGSTSTPKGVIVTHANVLHNSAYIHEGFEHTPESISLTWLPHFHDMGLLDGILQPLYGGFEGILMSPAAFLQRPLRWLQAVTRYGVTHTGGPNFAYDLCVRRIGIEARASLDLSSWDVAYSGAEPVRYETIKRFADAFAPCGFRERAFYPAYGLAEATLKVSGGRRNEPPVFCAVSAASLERNRVVESSQEEAGTRMLVGSGRATGDTQVVVVRPDSGERCAADEVGEIWVRGPGVAAGYWNRPEETEQTFHARLADDGAETFLRTGDLGFVRAGELYVTGRLKDLIIIRGRNHYPQDIELIAAQSHPALRAGGGAAFSVEAAGEERLVVLLELEHRRTPDVRSVIDAVRAAIAEEFEVQLHAVVLLKAGSVPKTSSGKIQRREARAKFLAGEFEAVAEWRASIDDEPASDAPLAGETGDAFLPTGELDEAGIEAWLRAGLSAKLRVDISEIEIERPLAAYGVDSLLALELTHDIETSFGVRLPPSELLQSRSLSQLAAQVLSQLASSSGVERIAAASSSSDGEPQPMSHGQQALWFLHKVAPESTAYHVAAALKIRGPLNAHALGRVFDRLTERHTALRTTFADAQGEPVQLVHERGEACFRMEDATALDEAAFGELLYAESQHPFNLEQGPLLRVALFKRAGTEHVLLLVAHHIIVDFWSLAVLMHELGVLYESETTGAPQSLVRHEVQFTDYARSRQQMLAGEEGVRLSAYWRRQLAGGLSPLDLPTDRPRPLVQTYRGAVRHLRLDAALSNRLRELGRTHDATLYMTLLAAFQVLLFRYTGQEDLTVGSPTSGRNSAQLAQLVGYFVNPVVIRAAPSSGLTFEQFLEQVRRTVLDAFEHQDYPFDLLVKQLQPARDPSRSPLFQAMFALHKAHLRGEEGLAAFALGEAGARMELGGLAIESMALEQRVAQFDLSLTVAEVGGELSAAFEYNTDLFDGATVVRMLDHFRVLLESIADEPQKHLASLRMLTHAESGQLLYEWSGTAEAFPAPAACVHELFERQAARTPESIAVVSGDERIRYRELNARANRLARFLRSRGVGPEVLVGLCVERSVEMIVGVLGILKAGGAYVPLDPAYPRERLAYMLEDSGARVLLGMERLVDELPPCGAQVVCFDAQAEQIALESDADSGSPATVENLVYVIYTSGSTGRPKGVLTGHASLAHYTNVAAREYEIGPGDCVLQFASLSFDASAEEIYPCLVSGATLVLCTPEAQASHADFLQLCRRERVSVLDLPTAFWHELAASLSTEDWAQAEALRLVVIGGERALPERLRAWRESTLGRVRLVNTYGPTEATIVATRCDLPPVAETLPERELPIGRPIPNASAYILNDELQPVPVGIKGELYLGGRGLSRGYLCRPRLTAERFIPDPFGAEPGARLYRTGDFARYRPDARIEFAGRIDEQVKVRGFRIELGEIEAALTQHARVREAVSVVCEDEGGAKRLRVYFVAAPGELPGAGELRRFMSERLPEYMLPHEFVSLAEMPLTPNGKLDRRALPGAAGVRLESGEGFVAPRTPREQALCDIWADVLRVERIGIHDNFFESGGDSIISLQVISRARQAGIDLAPRQIFEHPTIAELIAVAESNETSHAEREASDGDAPLTPDVPDVEGHATSDFPLAGLSSERLDALLGAHKDVSDVYPLSPLQQGILFHSLYAPGESMYVGHVSCILRGELNPDSFESAWRHVANEHAVLRTSFAWENLDEPLQLVHDRAPVSLERHDWRELPPEEQARSLDSFLVEERRRGFALDALPLMRLAVIRLGEEVSQFVWTHHHLLLDGWSLALLLREVLALYDAFERGAEAPPLRARPYRDYIEWLRRQDMTQAEAFWRETLKGFDAPTPLVPDRAVHAPDANGPLGPQQVREALLTSDLTGRLHEFARRHGLTLNTLVQGAWALLLSRYSREEDVVFGVTVAGRPPTLAGMDEIIGLFINTLPARVRIAPQAAASSWLKELQLEQARLREYEYAPLVSVHGWSEVPRGQNLFDSLLVFENHPIETVTPGPAARLQLDDVRSYDRTNYPLTVIAFPGRELLLKALYPEERFDDAAIERMLGHLCTLLEGFVASPHRSLAELPLMTEAERRQVLVEWNDTRREYSRADSIHGLFEAQARKTPERIALVHGDEELTYDELNARANRLAHYLRKLGVGPEVRAGVFTGRTIEMVVGLLGIMKTGGAYVPLDPVYPRERLAYMLKDSGVTVLLAQSDLLDRLPSHDVHVIRLDADWETIGVESDADPESRVEAENIAYVIYTSGSTGRPKGVAVTHRSVAAFSHWAGEVFAPESFAGTLAISSICFDLSVFELFVPLHLGGKVILVDSPLSVPEVPASHKVTLINTVPSAAGELLRLGYLPPSVETINLAGEPLPHKLVRQLYEQSGVRQVFNLYGPTEDTTYSTWALMNPDSSEPPSIGRPIHNTQAHILDRHMQPVPACIPGELYLGGDGLARGYLGSPELTAQKFVPNPFGMKPGARLYRTGDLALYRPGGELEFLGRIDHQVKVRGHRIELGEIEAVLGEHATVKDCVLTAREDAPGDIRLTAYVVARNGEASAIELRNFLKSRLLEHMVPSAFVMLDEIPLTPNGKIDRRALPAPETARPDIAEDYIAPRNAVEEALAGIWSEVLGVERVGAHDNFFELGGHSLLATRVLSGIRNAFRMQLPLHVVFEAATLARLAQAVAAHETKPGQVERIAGVLQKIKGLSADELQAELRRKRSERGNA